MSFDQATLRGRGVIEVAGREARPFLANLVTSQPPPAGTAGYGALLTPQGKIIADFVMFGTPAGVLLDVAAAEVQALLRRLQLYRLRADVTLADRSGAQRILAAWGGAWPASDGWLPDPRLPALGWRRAAIADAGADDAADDPAGDTAYHRHRIGLGVPEGGADYAFGDVYPHDAGLDQLAGVDFAKGCYVGQEVVSRMEHRGTARRRFVQVTGDGDLAAGSAIVAGARALGTLGSVAGRLGIGLVRLDRVAEAFSRDEAVLAGEVPVRLTIPVWATFGWPVPAAAAAP